MPETIIGSAVTPVRDFLVFDSEDELASEGPENRVDDVSRELPVDTRPEQVAADSGGKDNGYGFPGWLRLGSRQEFAVRELPSSKDGVSSLVRKGGMVKMDQNSKKGSKNI